MKNILSENQKTISSDMTVLYIVSKYRETESVFKKYDKIAGECICCNALFDPVKKVAENYNIDLNNLLDDLENVI